MDDTTLTFLKSLLAGLVDRGAIVAAVWLVDAKILPSDQEVNAEHVIAAGIIGIATLAFVWWREHGRSLLKTKVAQFEAAQPAPAPAPVAPAK